MSTSCITASVFSKFSMDLLAPSRMEPNTRGSHPINSGMARAAASTCSESSEASEAMVGSISPCTRYKSTSNLSTLHEGHSRSTTSARERKSSHAARRMEPNMAD